MSKTFTLLSDLPMIKIDRCAQILPNKLQCPRTGVYLVQDAAPTQSPSSSSSSGGTTSGATQDQGTGSKKSPPAAAKPPQGSQPSQSESSTQGGSQDQSAKNPPADKTGSPTTPAPASSGGVGPTAPASSPAPEPYQLCIMHKVIAERAQEQAAKTGQNPDELQAKILGDEENYRLNHPPISPQDFKSLAERDKELKKEEEHDTQSQPTTATQPTGAAASA